MGTRGLHQAVMRRSTSPSGSQGPPPAFAAADLLLVTVGLFGALFGLLVAASHPLAALGVVALALVARPLARLAAGRRTRRPGPRRRYRIPATRIVIEL